MAKLLAIVDICIELFMFIYEVYRLRNLTKQSIDVITIYSEEKRRAIYHKRYFGVAMTSLAGIIASVLALSFLLPPKVCRQQQSLEFGTVCTDCKLDSCVDCAEVGADRCTTCDVGYFYDEDFNFCSDCDEFSEAVRCKKCTGLNQCIECN